MTLCSHVAGYGHALGRVMPSLRMRVLRVVRFIPSRAAAPVGTAMTQFASRRTRKMCSRSTASSAAARLPSKWISFVEDEGRDLLRLKSKTLSDAFRLALGERQKVEQTNAELMQRQCSKAKRGEVDEGQRTVFTAFMATNART